MQTAIAPARSAREAVNDGRVLNTALDLHRPHFFVQMGWNVLGVDTPAIPNSYLLRGEITPCQSFRAKERLPHIPEGALIAGSEERDQEGRITYGQYWKYAHYESERLAAIEASKESKDGLIELKTLHENPRLYEAVDFNKLFYPQGLDMLPEKNLDLAAHLRKRCTEIKASPPEGLHPVDVTTVLEIGEQIARAAEEANRIQSDRLRYTHKCLEAPLTDAGGMHKRNYDGVDDEMLLRTGTPRMTEEKIRSAQAQEAMVEAVKGNNSNTAGDTGAIFALVEIMKQQLDEQKAQNAAQTELINKLMNGTIDADKAKLKKAA